MKKGMTGLMVVVVAAIFAMFVAMFFGCAGTHYILVPSLVAKVSPAAYQSRVVIVNDTKELILRVAVDGVEYQNEVYSGRVATIKISSPVFTSSLSGQVTIVVTAWQEIGRDKRFVGATSRTFWVSATQPRSESWEINEWGIR